MGEMKPGWKRVKLGDVVDVVTDYWDRDPNKPERFVAGEHIDEGSLKVARWGMTSDELVPPTFNRRFKAGDVLFHSRNLCKLARPDFSGITGEKLFVLRSKSPRDLNPELLPFLLQTNAFNDYVNSMWAGSTNKFLNKAPLIRYEFALPPPEDQCRLIPPLRSCEAVLDSMRAAGKSARQLYTSLLSHSLCRIGGVPETNPATWAPRGWPCVPLERVVSAASPICYGIVQPGDSVAGGIPTVTSNNLNVGFQTSIHATAPAIEARYVRSRIHGGDVLVTVKGFGTGNIGVVPDFFTGNITRDLARLRFPDATDALFFLHMWRSPAFERYWKARSVGTTRPELSIGNLRAMVIPWPSKPVRAELAMHLSRAVAAVDRFTERFGLASATHRMVLGRVLQSGS